MNGGDFVKSARQLSLAVLAIAALGVQLGLLNSARIHLLGEAETAAAIQWVINQANNADIGIKEECAGKLGLTLEDMRVRGLRFRYFDDQRIDSFIGYMLRAERGNPGPPIRVVEHEYAINGWNIPIWISSLESPNSGQIYMFAGSGEPASHGCKEPIPELPDDSEPQVRLFDFDAAFAADCGGERFTRIVFEIPPDSTGRERVRWMAELPHTEVDPNESIKYVCSGEREDDATVTVYQYSHSLVAKSGPVLASVSTIGDDRKWITAPFDLLDPTITGKLRELARHHEIEGDPKEEENLVKIVARVSRDLYERQLSFGVSAGKLTFSSEQAVWILALIEFVLLVVLRSRLTQLESTTDLGRGTPWLFLDGRSGLERFVANAWLVSLLLGPWALLLSLTLTAADGVAAKSVGPREALGTLLQVLVIWLLVAWASMTNWLVAHRVRTKRRNAEREAVPGFGTTPES